MADKTTNGRGDTALPPMMTVPFGFEALMELNRPALQAMAQMKILHAVIEDECVDAHVTDGVQCALDAVFVHQHNHVLQTAREHVRFIAGGT